MLGALISPASVVRSLVAYGLGALGFLRLVNWAILLAGLAVGLFLILRAKRPLAGAGTIVMAASTWIAFFVMPPAWIWTSLFFLGAILIAWGTTKDTASPNPGRCFCREWQWAAPWLTTRRTMF
jgi:hypothetical protein